MSEAPRPNKRLVTRLLMLVVAMFAFGFALVPLYDVMCKALGINGKTGDQYTQTQQVDDSRQVRVQFLATNNADMTWGSFPRPRSCWCTLVRSVKCSSWRRTRPTSR